VMDVADQIDFIEEMIHPLCGIEEKPLNGNNLPIRQNSLVWHKEMYLVNFICKN